jgi:hypothetical protein
MKTIKRLPFLMVVSLFVMLFFAIISCNKDIGSSIPEDSMLDLTLVNQISSSIEFNSLSKNIRDIKIAINNPNNFMQENLIFDDLLNKCNSITNESTLSEFLYNLGYKNADIISRLSIINNELLLKIFLKFPCLNKFNKKKIMDIINSAYKNLVNDHSNKYKAFFVLDECSNNFANGMENCNNTLGWDLVEASVAGILAIVGTPIVSTGTILTLSGIAYAKNFHCKTSVVSQWRTCRMGNPIQAL